MRASSALIRCVPSPGVYFRIWSIRPLPFRSLGPSSSNAPSPSESTGTWPVRPPAPLEAPRPDQVLDDLLGEEGIARRARVDRLGQAPQAGVGAQQVVQQLTDGLGPERSGSELVVPRLLHPVGVVLGTEVYEQQRLRSAHGLDDLREKGVAADKRLAAFQINRPAETCFKRIVVRPDISAPGTITFFKA